MSNIQQRCFQWYVTECFSPKNVNMDKKCLICNRRFLSHSRTMKCISLDNDERSNILRDANSWFCSLRLTSKFPINHIEDDSDFSKAICTKDNLKLGELHFSDKISNPMQILDREMNNLLDDSDPDLHFYNEIATNLYISVITWQSPALNTRHHYPRVHFLHHYLYVT